MYLVSRARANSYSEHDAICMICMNATKIQPSMHNAMKKEMPRSARTRARKPRRRYMQCKWLNGMEKVTWTYTNMREHQPHSHKKSIDKNEVPRNACTRARKPRQWHTQCKWHENMIWKHANGISALKCGGKQPRNEVKVHPMHGIVPKHDL